MTERVKVEFHFPDDAVSVPGVRIRNWAPDDADDLVRAWNDPEMHRWMPEEPDPFGRDEAQQFIADAAKHASEGTALLLAVADAVTSRAIGSVSFHVWAPGHWSIGYWLTAAHRGRGIATEAVTRLSRWAFSAYPDIQRLSLYTLPGNKLSQAVAMRAGFTREGRLRKWGDVGGRRFDWVMFSLIREDVEQIA